MKIGERSGLKLGQATRDAFGDALKEFGGTHAQVVTVDGDVGNSTRTEVFAQAYPDRAFNVGIAESNLVSVAGGLAACGKIPVVASFACFLLNNAYDQIRMSVAFPSPGQREASRLARRHGLDRRTIGPSQMGIPRDVALAPVVPRHGGHRALRRPRPLKKATAAMLTHEGPTYLQKLGRPEEIPVVYPNGCDFEIGAKPSPCATART